jgi:hypothetical protein
MQQELIFREDQWIPSQPSDFHRNWQASCLTAVLHFGSQKNRIHEFRVVFLILWNPSFPNTKPKLSNTVGCYFFAGYFYLLHVVPTSAIPCKQSQLLLKFASMQLKVQKHLGKLSLCTKLTSFCRHWKSKDKMDAYFLQLVNGLINWQIVWKYG